MLDVRLEDFTLAAPPSAKGKFNLLVCNPPYVRHHHIASEEKRRLKALTREACGIKVNGPCRSVLFTSSDCLTSGWRKVDWRVG